ncbi:MAG: PEP-CTERM sorting domain-containing protein [Planctomycetota bacterium]
MRLAILLFMIASCAPVAAADVLAVTQYFRLQNLTGEAGDEFSSFISFDAAVDTSTITGVGAEQAVVTAHFANLWSQTPDTIIRPDAIGQVGGRGSLPGFDNSDPYLDTPGNIRAEFLDGVFTGFFVIDNPATTGGDYLHLFEPTTGFGGLFTIGATTVFYGADILNISRYDLHSTVIIPAPSTALALFAAVGALGTRRRR